MQSHSAIKYIGIQILKREIHNPFDMTGIKATL